MEWFSANGYELARQVLQRGIAAIYLIAFISTLAQFRVLLGETRAAAGGRVSRSRRRPRRADRLPGADTQTVF